LKLEIWVAEEYFSILNINQNNGHFPPYDGVTPLKYHKIAKTYKLTLSYMCKYHYTRDTLLSHKQYITLELSHKHNVLHQRYSIITQTPYITLDI